PVKHRLGLIRLQGGIVILGGWVLLYGPHSGIVLTHNERLALEHIRLILFGYAVELDLQKLIISGLQGGNGVDELLRTGDIEQRPLITIDHELRSHHLLQHYYIISIYLVP